MITLMVQNINSELTQELYDRIIDNTNIHNLKCSCGDHNFIIHGYYSRNVKTNNNKYKLIVMRVKCKSCNKTHAILISLLVPYLSLALNVQIRIINNDHIDELLIDNISINETIIYRTKRRYNSKYKKWVILNDLKLDINIIKEAFYNFKSNFMQMRKAINLLNTSTT